ncbi:MAG: RagB/SusD family nutrient uptake outer membrane protein [Bacteroidales bacterium]|nr:RagB/SusD family nutrient uptake outer membrane protein [Bacteroidales bacterium]
MKKLLLYTLSIALVIVSCEEFLDVKPTNQADAGSAIGTPADAQVMMNGLMRSMSSLVYYGRDMFLYADSKGGDLCVGGRGRGYDGLYVFNHSQTLNSGGDFWSQIYFCVTLANNLIINIQKMIEEGKGSAALNHTLAQALTARAIFYYDLVRLWGKPYDMDRNSYGVPLNLEVLDATAQPTRASVAEVYTQILADLNAAVPLFNRTQRNNGFINYYANVAMQARIHLQMQNYAAALTAAEDVIQNGGYALYTNENWITSWSRQFQSESIFELHHLPTELGGTTGSLGAMMIHTQSTLTAWNYFIASTSFLERLGEDPADIRWGLMDLDEKAKESPSSVQYIENRQGCCYKYVGGISVRATYDTGTIALGDGKSTRTAVNIKVIRLSEIYLIAAEAALGANNRDKAATYLQAIRKRAPNLEPATAANVTLQMVKDERSKELLMEGHRFFDMLRWNETIVYDSDWLSQSPVTSRPESIDRTYFKAIYPITQNEINANPAIASQQNPGY